MYIPAFSRLSSCIKMDRKGGTVSIPQDVFKRLIMALAAGGACDGAWYGTAYRDLAEALHENAISDPIRHFAEAGWFEGRRPRRFDVDEAWYLTRYPDVAESVASGKVASAHTHYNATGYEEGRVPSAELEAEVEGWNAIITRHAPKPLPDLAKAAG